MSSYPKHYLTDVPQELRLRILDLCIHRQWHDALDLLQQNGFTQYEWYELVWFHDHAPTNLDVRSADACRAEASREGGSALECGGLTPLSIPTDSPQSGIQELASEDLNASRPPSSIQEPASTPSTLTASETLTATEPNLNGPVKVPKPHSKIARLPTDIQQNLNAMLAEARPYQDIIRYLNDQGHPGFNKVNLHNWRNTGFQNWLQTQQFKTKAA